MAKTLLQTTQYTTVSASTTRYAGCFSGGLSVSDTEANKQRTFRTAGVLSMLYVRVSSNGITGTTPTVICLRKNGANGNMVVSIPSGATGEFRDAGATDSVAAGDEINYSIVAGTSGSSIAIYTISTSFSATSNTVSVLGHSTLVTFTSALTVIYFPPSGYSTSYSTIELNRQVQSNTAGTLKNLFVYVSTNTRTTASTLVSRIDTATGNLSISITATTTGIFEDTANSDAVTANQTVGTRLTLGNSLENLRIEIISAEFETTNSKTFLGGGGSAGSNITISTIGYTLPTSYFGISHGREYATTESYVSAEVGMGLTLSNLWLYVSANTLSTATTMDLRKNQASTAVTLSITASTTGAFEDTTNSVSYLYSDEACVRFNNGDTPTGSATVTNWSLLAESTDTAIEIRVNDTITTTESATTTAHRSISMFDYLFPADSKIEVPGSNYFGGPIVYGSTGTLEAAAQSFVAISTKLSSMQIYLVRSGTPGDDITINITASLGGASLGSATVVAPPTAYTTVTFTDPVTLTSGNTYYAEVTRTGSRNTSNFIYGQMTSPTYEFPLGDAYYRSSGVWTNYSSSFGDWRSSFTFTGIQTLTMDNLAISVSDSISTTEYMDHGNISLVISDSISISENVATGQTTSPYIDIQIGDEIIIEDTPTFDSIRYSADAGHDGINGTMRNIKGNS